ncbi:MAG TPA: CidA/LrgA family protein [Tepidisphaeraceae bacterium]|jgi:holin-like protein|nr:CidA/LrgA family protein [Tepidisphaeraceae bacterium]
MRGFAILLLANLLGLFLHHYAHVPLPANVIGLILLLIGLGTGIVKQSWVETASTFVLRHMLLLFAPVIVGALALGQVLKADWPALLATGVVSPLVTLIASAILAKFVIDDAGEPVAAGDAPLAATVLPEFSTKRPDGLP